MKVAFPASEYCRKDGINLEQELTLRFDGCQWIYSACILLRLPHVAASLAQRIFHQFYYHASFMQQQDMHAIAMACVLTASKHVECPRKLTDVIPVFGILTKQEMEPFSQVLRLLYL